ncbi:cytochrome c oxidase subunit II [Allosphingosinicella sp.]|uniref:cytochrome c oxidase subunit II n=1 Tax=Allosphingosinicella sp. TaxID=2823234 RepID=UPI003D7300DF
MSGKGLPPVLDTAGPQADPIATLSWVLIVGGGVILLIILVALGIALFGGAWRRKFAGERMVIIGGILFPVVTLTGLLTYGLGLTAGLVGTEDADPVRIHVTGEQWWWRVEYLEPARFTSANEIVIPVGRPALIDLASDNVIHSFWVPELAGKLDMIPGKTNRIRLLAEEPGVYFGACAEYCGGPHALMLFRVRALPPADYARWVRRESGSAMPPSESLAAEGAALFQTLGCGGCHQVRGTRSRGLAGPDLTHVASRLHLGAGILPNNKGTLGGWVANPQRLKPGVKMPAYSALSARELRALVTYMDGLE